MEESRHYIEGYLSENDREAIERMAIKCFTRGLKTQVVDKIKAEDEHSFQKAISAVLSVKLEISNCLKHREKSGFIFPNETDRRTDRVGIKIVEPTEEITMAPFIDTPQIKNCQYCKSQEHTADKCAKVRNNNAIDICHYCKKRGHLADKCKKIGCAICGRKGHWAEICYHDEMWFRAEGHLRPKKKEKIPTRVDG